MIPVSETLVGAECELTYRYEGEVTIRFEDTYSFSNPAYDGLTADLQYWAQF